MEKLLTLKEIASEIGVPESNLRYYRNRISDFLPSAGRGRKRRYFPEATDVFRKAVGWLQEGMTLDRVYGLLATEGLPIQSGSPFSATGQAISTEQLEEAVQKAVAAALHSFVPPTQSASASESVSFEPVLDQLQSLANRVESSQERVLEAINAIPTQGSNGPDYDHEAAQRASELEKDHAVLEERFKRLEMDVASLRKENAQQLDMIQERDRVIEEQRARLLEIRALRNSFLDEVRQLRTMIQTTGGRPGATPGAG